MNYFYIIFFLIFVYFIYNKYNPEKNKVNLKIKQNKSTNLNDSNFIKPDNKLFKLFKNASQKNKINLTTDYVQRMYTKDTINQELFDKILIYINILLKKILNVNYNIDYSIKNIVNVYQEIDFYGNERYIVNTFIYDIKNYYNFKIIIDFVIINNNLYINYIGEDISSNINLINKYDYTMSNIGYLENKEQINDDIKNIMDSYYKKNYKLIGYDKSKIHYSNYLSKLDTIYKIEDLKKLYLPEGITNKYDINFCRKDNINWDKYGIKKLGNSNCMVNNNSTIRQPNLPYDSPATLPKQQREKSKLYGWIQGVDYNSGGNVVSSSWYH